MVSRHGYGMKYTNQWKEDECNVYGYSKQERKLNEGSRIGRSDDTTINGDVRGPYN